MRRCVSNCGLLRLLQATALPTDPRPTSPIARTAGQVEADIIGLVDSKHGTAANRDGPCRTACASLTEGISWRLPVCAAARHNKCKRGLSLRTTAGSGSEPSERACREVGLVPEAAVTGAATCIAASKIYSII